MDRTADYTIQGFLYQFNKTLLEVLRSADEAEITVEGIIEDIEIVTPEGLTAIQCKYHEAKESFTPSTIFKPLLQMMQHFHTTQHSHISYILFAHFPEPPKNNKIGKSDLEEALASKNEKLQKYCDDLRGKVDLDKFLAKISLQFGPTLDDMVNNVQAALVAAGIPASDVDVLSYPNAIQAIANLSIKHDPKQRRITKAELLDSLTRIKSTAISRWTLALKTRKQILEARRKQMKPHLDKNARLRYFIVNCATLEDFDANVVGFFRDFLAKFHFKAAHICTPLVCLDTTEDIFRDIQLRLHRKGVISTDGYVGRIFDESYFLREPIVQKAGRAVGLRREFQLRFLRWINFEKIIAGQKPDDLFILGKNGYTNLDIKDIVVEELETFSIKEIAFITGVNPSYE
ncbi:hypothetical protein CfE428DRAFT_4738 [Chthoniobacter flavus Ellin428]|uniref:Uncharacterized protein n=1 Tax=Chthoniobacter flavus Ellin428 TaxID=497964 RepID=B4D748_9BACT|nr:hypothetical protein [Chthoniobacter flavus]EDY17699.1 hypothetical protein CfE428DRAFT_4738 [Chthoniobacter flavus Ellin428]TCO87025.1 hypothetical protein EV701_1242 [Chthoniobacter flavus]